MNTLFATAPMRLLGALTAVMLVVALGSYAALNVAQMQHLDMMPPMISVSGEGEMLAVPDVGQFTFSVEATALDAVAAQEQSGTKVNDIITFLTESGVAEVDINTQSYNLYPNYRWEETICIPGTICRGGEQVQDGFVVNQTVEVKIRDTDTASSIITGVGEREATNISGLNFVVDDTDALQAEARSLAVADARAKAELLAADLGVSLGRITGYFEEDPRYAPEPMYARTMAFDEMSESDFGGPSLPMGEEKVGARVNITYEIR